MLNIIRSDVYRIFRGRAIYITLGLFIAFVAMQAASGAGNIGIITDEMLETQAEVAARGADAPAIAAGALVNIVYFLLPLAVVIGGADFSADSTKNVLARGVTRTRYYAAKLVPLLVVTLLVVLLNTLVSVVTVTALHGFGGELTGRWLWEALRPCLYQAVSMMAYSAVALAVAMMTKRTAAVIGIYIAFALVPAIIVLLLTSLVPELQWLDSYDLMSILGRQANPDLLSSGDLLRGVLVGLFWLVGSTALGAVVFSRTDIK